MLKSTNEPLSETYTLALLDLDGVVYKGKLPIEHATPSIIDAQQRGMVIEYTTNNSSRMQSVVADQLQGFGLDVKPHQVITSSVVAARMVARAVGAGASVYVLGAEHLRDEITRAGLTITEDFEHASAAIQGWYPQMTWQDMAHVAFAVEHGAQYFVTNRDLTIPREYGIAPGCGSMIQAVINATGVEPVSSAGKPESHMYDEARILAASEGQSVVPKEQCLAIGDRLDTDIEAGTRGGYDTFAVLTGVADARQIIYAPQELRPTYIAQDLRGLNESHPQVVRLADGMWQCRNSTVRVVEDRLEFAGPVNIDALRAACMLMWTATDEGSADQDAVLDNAITFQ